jgi:hypothetical protein
MLIFLLMSCFCLQNGVSLSGFLISFLSVLGWGLTLEVEDRSFETSEINNPYIQPNNPEDLNPQHQGCRSSGSHLFWVSLCLPQERAPVPIVQEIRWVLGLIRTVLEKKYFGSHWCSNPEPSSPKVPSTISRPHLLLQCYSRIASSWFFFSLLVYQ